MLQSNYEPGAARKEQLPYELTFEERPGYLYARVTAENMTGYDARVYLTQITEEAARLGQQRIMVDRRIPMMLDAGTLFFAIKDLIDRIHGTRLVFVNPYPELDDDMEFAIKIATNRGADHNVAR